MYYPVNRLQIHEINNRQCNTGDPTRQCKFGFLKEPIEKTKCENDYVVYRLTVSDENVNDYNPYLLDNSRTSMDIQYNDGPQTVRYLVKCLIKDNYKAK
jgi:hypothetical protein